ncbi:MAG: hypothetical protein U0271_36930 [Polyangiaceae bacterium]
MDASEVARLLEDGSDVARLLAAVHMSAAVQRWTTEELATRIRDALLARIEDARGHAWDWLDPDTRRGGRVSLAIDVCAVDAWLAGSGESAAIPGAAVAAMRRIARTRARAVELAIRVFAWVFQRGPLVPTETQEMTAGALAGLLRGVVADTTNDRDLRITAHDILRWVARPSMGGPPNAVAAFVAAEQTARATLRAEGITIT